MTGLPRATSPPRLWRLWLLLVAAAVASSCLRDATGPRLVSGHLAVAPAFEGGAAGIVPFDRIRVTLVRPGGGGVVVDGGAPGVTVLDTVIAIPASADSIDLTVSVPLAAASEDLLFYLRLIDAGDTVFRNSPYPQPVTVTAQGGARPVETPIVYVGVGFDAVAVIIATPDTVVSFGQTLQLNAVALGLTDQTIPGTPIAWRSLDSTRVRVPNRAVGQVVGGTARGTARIVAQLLTGPADTVLVTAQPTPSALTRISGDSQTAVPGVALPVPLRVRVTALDGLGVRVPVTFTALTAGDSMKPGLVLSDSTGFAEAIAVLGPAAGTHSFQASVSGIAAPVMFSATAVSGTPLPAVVFAGDSTDGVVSNGGVFRVNSDGSARSRLNDRGRVGDVHPRWSPDRRRVALTADDGSGGPNVLFVVVATGDTVATVVADSSARRPRWSPDGVHLAFECGDGFSVGQDVCVLPDVTGAVTTLNSLEAQRIVVTDVTGDRLDGPASFAWDPTDPKRLIVVRDSLTAFGLASRLWTVGFDGGAPLPLSPVLDVGKGPLTIAGPLDITPDGATIVFAASDSTATRTLYLIERDGSGLRQLTGGPGFDQSPVFSPDGRQVLFLRDNGCSLDYWRVDVQSRVETQVSQEGWCDFSSGGLGHDWSPDGKDIVLVGGEPPGGFADTRIYRIPAATTAATYLQDRRLIGRGSDPGAFVRDIQPSWRP
ncbi:MAG TPA: hypothetical protein VGQ06_15140 [Gemmatimonadales bacterium]|nr:hypothetical protein [Gemmatimonadales bacterium]